MGRPRKEASRDTKKEILDRALDLFAEHGFSATSMRQIAKAVGVRESALYHHFPSKESILERMLDTFGPGISLQITEIDVGSLVEALGAKGVLRQMMEMVLAVWATPQEQKIFRLMLSEGPRLDGEGVIHPSRFLFRARERVATIFEALMKRKLIRKSDPMTLTLEFIAPLVMLRFLYLVMPSQAPNLKRLKAEADAHLEHFWRSIAPEGEKA